MARALLGYVGSASEQTLTLELARLRRRVQELETEVAQLRANHRHELEVELHRLAEGAEPAMA
jgi:ABC-type phosphate transport system auxiliary subunit